MSGVDPRRWTPDWWDCWSRGKDVRMSGVNPTDPDLAHCLRPLQGELAQELAYTRSRGARSLRLVCFDGRLQLSDVIG